MNLEKNKFKLLYYDKAGKVLELLILYMEFTQDLFDEEEKFGTFRIVAFGKMDRDINEILSDNAKEPLLILSMEQELLLDEINGKFILPLYVKNANVFDKYDEATTVYQFLCKPFVYAIFQARTRPFSLQIKPKELGKLPNIRELLEEYVSRQPILHGGGSVLIKPASTKLYDLIKSSSKQTPQPVTISSDSEENFNVREGYNTVVNAIVPSSIKPAANKFLKSAESIVEHFEKNESPIMDHVISQKNIPSNLMIKISKQPPFKSSNLERAANISESRKNNAASKIEAIKNKRNDILSRVNTSVSNFQNSINSLCSNFGLTANPLNRIASLISGFVNTLINYSSMVANYVSNLINNVINNIANFKNKLFGTIQNTISAISSRINSLIGSLGQCLREFTNLVGDLTRSISNIASILENLPNNLRTAFNSAIGQIVNSIVSLSQVKLPTLAEVIKIIESGLTDSIKQIRTTISSALGIDIFAKKSKNEIVNFSSAIVSASSSISDFIPVGNIIEAVSEKIEEETNLLYPIEEDDINQVDQIIRNFVRDEIANIISDMNDDLNTLNQLFSGYINETMSFLNDILNTIPQNTTDPMEIALINRTDELINELNNINISDLTSLFDPNSFLWNNILDLMEEIITDYLSLLLLNLQEAYALVSYGESTTTPEVSGGIVDPVKTVQIVFGIEEAEVINFDKVTSKIAKNLNDIIYPLYTGTIYTTLNKMIRDLCPSPVSNFLSIAYYYKDGKSHAFFRYRLYPGAFELGRSDLEMCSSECPLQLNSENIFSLQKAFFSKVGSGKEGGISIGNNFGGFPSKKVEITSSLGGGKFKVLIDIEEHFANAVFCGKSLSSKEKNFLVTPIPEASSVVTELPIQVENLAYNGLMIGKLFGNIANNLVKNPLIETEFNLVGKDAYVFFLLLWVGDIMSLNIMPLIDKTMMPLKSFHMFLPRFLVTKKTFYYLNHDYKDVLAKYIKPKVEQPLQIEFRVASNDDGMKKPPDFSGQSFFSSVEKAYEKCLILEI